MAATSADGERVTACCSAQFERRLSWLLTKLPENTDVLRVLRHHASSAC